MNGAKSALTRTRGALPRKIACGDICGGPEGALCQMLCEFEIRSLNKTVAKNRDHSCRRRHPKPSYSDEMRESPAAQDSRCITPQNRLRRCLRGPRRGSLSNAMRVQGGFDAVICRIRRLQKTAIFRVRQGSASRTGRAVYLSYISGRAGGADAVIRRLRRLQKTAIFRVGDGTLNRLIRMRCAKAPLRRTRGVLVVHKRSAQRG